MDERKRKRMESNRESARRSRMRKQIQLNELNSQVGTLNQEKKKLINELCETREGCLIVETENAVLRTRAFELENRLEALNLILGQIVDQPLMASMELYNYCYV
ncbi:hypothetical protein LUZ60_001029 [Juncus effusus]|nr:hypothetical protein LUZ60_001029 [Juncus effusus]